MRARPQNAQHCVRAYELNIGKQTYIVYTQCLPLDSKYNANEVRLPRTKVRIFQHNANKMIPDFFSKFILYNVLVT